MRPRPGAALGLAALSALSACESAVDRQRAAICRRAVPALAPAAGVLLLRTGAGPGKDSVRVDYRVAGDPSRQHWAVCGFGPGAGLVAVTTERGPLNGAALYLLGRYYLDTPEAEAADPGMPPAR